MTTTTQHSAPPLSPQRLAQFIDAIRHLPEQVPAVPAADGVDDSIDQLRDSIRSLADRLSQRQRTDATLTAVTKHVVQGVYLEKVLDHIYEGFRGLLPYDRIGCGLLEEHATVLRARWARTEFPAVHPPAGYAANISASSLAAVVASGTHDALTGIKNRRAILHCVDELQRKNGRRPRESALILLDIDHFKSINDTYGHPAGDAVLCEVARRIASAIRAGDEVGRYGGEEFLVCLDEVTPDGVTHVAARILDVIRGQPIPLVGGFVSVTASAGLSHTSDIAAADIEAMIGQADASLYRAKAAGRDRFMNDDGGADEHTRH